MRQKLFYGIILGTIVALFSILLYVGGFFVSWQNRLTDTLFLPSEVHEDIVIIAIDDNSLVNIGRWPWDRSVHAELLEIIGDAPVVVGYDVAFPEASTEEDDQRLRRAFQENRFVVIPEEVRSLGFSQDTVIVPSVLSSIPLFTEVTQSGVVDTIADGDSITRHIPVKIQSEEDKNLQHFSFAIAQMYLTRTGNMPLSLDEIPTVRGTMRINFVNGPGSFTTYSFVDVLDGTIPISAFEDKIVLVGSTARNLPDEQLVPVSSGVPMSGVEIHANTVQTLITRNFLQQESTIVTIATIIFLSYGLSIVLTFLGPITSVVAAGLTLILYLLYSFISFDMGTIRNLAFPLMIVAGLGFLHIAYKYFIEYRQKRFLRKAFELYVPKSVLDEIIQYPDHLSLGGQKKNMTVMFIDIAGFTTLSESMSPEELSSFLNYYLTRASKKIFEHGGVIDKFYGDAIISFWNAPLDDPEHAINACKAAYEIRLETKAVREELGLQNFGVRVGINTGEMVVGNMGSEMRFNYTVLGDNVNIGARLETINKIYGTRIMVSESTYQAAKEGIVARFIDYVQVKGKTKGLKIYELIRTGVNTAEDEQFIREFEEAHKLYTAGKFRPALRKFSAYKEKYPFDVVVDVFIERTKEHLDHPPKEWDGIYHSTIK